MAGIAYFSKELKIGAADFFKNISVFLNLLLLTAVYLLGVGTVFIISRVSGKRFLSLEIDEETATYWEKRDDAGEPAPNFYRQF